MASKFTTTVDIENGKLLVNYQGDERAFDCIPCPVNAGWFTAGRVLASRTRTGKKVWPVRVVAHPDGRNGISVGRTNSRHVELLGFWDDHSDAVKSKG